MNSVEFAASLVGETLPYWLPMVALAYMVGRTLTLTAQVAYLIALGLVVSVLFAGDLAQGRPVGVQMLAAALGGCIGLLVGQSRRQRISA